MQRLGLILVGALLMSSMVSNPAQAQKKTDKRFQPPTEVAGLPRVLLIGDSISIGYTLKVRELLKDKANLYRIPTNGNDTKSGVEKLASWLGDSKWDVIHFNWGLHDIKNSKGKNQVPLDDYEKNLRAMLIPLKATGAKLIWCSTTPVPDVKMTPVRLNSDVMAYNAAAQKIMDENDVAIDDLYAFAAPQLEKIQLPANVHYSKDGYDVLAGQVAKSIGETVDATPAK